ncbi:MAG TPA: hypothetical protein VMR45_05735 [Patescibacteria group bacterium]|nr:hypothetical protein [Patescibacteria group bacterium]
MESLENLLGRYSPKAPDEVTCIKEYVMKEFNVQAKVGLQGEAITITVPSAALANTLRLRTTAIQTAANTAKRLIFRIS